MNSYKSCLKGPVLSIMLHAPEFGLHRSEASIVQRRVKHNGQYWVFKFGALKKTFQYYIPENFLHFQLVFTKKKKQITRSLEYSFGHKYNNLLVN